MRTRGLQSVPAANQLVGHHQRDVVGVVPSRALHCQRHVRQWVVIVTVTDLSTRGEYKLELTRKIKITDTESWTEDDLTSLPVKRAGVS